MASVATDAAVPIRNSVVWLSPAGIRIFCSQQRSQRQNRELAMQLLRAKLFERELQKQRESVTAQRKSQVSSFCGKLLSDASLWLRWIILADVKSCGGANRYTFKF